MRSMTGYGRASSTPSTSADQAIQEGCVPGNEGWAYAWEIKSVNGRHLDVRWRAPASTRRLEAGWESLVRCHAFRGRVECSLHLTVMEPALLGVRLNRAMARAMTDELRALAAEEGREHLPDYNRLLHIAAVWEEDHGGVNESMAAGLTTGLEAALHDWNNARSREGALLAEDLRARFAHLRTLQEEIAARVTALGPQKAKALEERLQSFLTRHNLAPDEHLLMQEVAVLSDRMDVSEELTRLSAHLGLLEELTAQGGECGKKLDFTLQECFREINTCSNKSQDAQVSQLAVAFKAELEKCREQVQNIE